VIVVEGGKVARAVSIPIGAVRQKERHLESDPPTAAQARALIAEIDQQLAQALGPGSGALPRGAPLVASAGTATTMAAVHLKLFDYDPAKVQGLRLSTMAVERMLAKFLESDTITRRAMRGMEPQRADVIPAGAAIFARLMNRIGASEMIVCDRGVRWGLAYELAEKR
jgi:exopolyphosphatase/guanosine-5'-triphosphate,3'-diphosphate pyrophosphatase